MARCATSCRFVPPRTSSPGAGGPPGPGRHRPGRNGPRVCSTLHRRGRCIWWLGERRTGRECSTGPIWGTLALGPPAGRQPTADGSRFIVCTGVSAEAGAGVSTVRRQLLRDDGLKGPRRHPMQVSSIQVQQNVPRREAHAGFVDSGATDATTVLWRHSANRWCRSRSPGSTTTRSNRSGKRGTGEPSGSTPRSSNPYAAARTRTRLR